MTEDERQIEPEAPEAEALEPEADEPSEAGALSALQARVADLEDQLLRLHADFDNYRRRVRRDQEDMQRRQLADLVRPLLGHLDNLERALIAGGDVQTFRQGVELTLRGLKEHMAALGVAQVAAKGAPFDPRLHEALMEEESDLPPGTVIDELQTGWTLEGVLLRPALVKVARARSGEGD